MRKNRKTALDYSAEQYQHIRDELESIALHSLRWQDDQLVDERDIMRQGHLDRPYTIHANGSFILNNITELLNELIWQEYGEEYGRYFNKDMIGDPYIPKKGAWFFGWYKLNFFDIVQLLAYGKGIRRKKKEKS